MQHLDQDDQPRVLREIRVNAEPGRVAENADDHRRLPAQLDEHRAEHEHREDLGDLADAHDRRDPVAGDADLLALEEDARPVEIAVVHESIDQCHDPEDQDERMTEHLERFQPGQPFPVAARHSRFDQPSSAGVCGSIRLNAASKSDATPATTNVQRVLCLRASPTRGVPSTVPSQFTNPWGFLRADLLPVHHDEHERPRRQNPADRAAHPDQAELLLRVLHVRERDRVRDGDRRDVKQAVDEHQDEKRPELR